MLLFGYRRLECVIWLIYIQLKDNTTSWTVSEEIYNRDLNSNFVHNAFHVSLHPITLGKSSTNPVNYIHDFKITSLNYIILLYCCCNTRAGDVFRGSETWTVQLFVQNVFTSFNTCILFYIYAGPRRWFISSQMLMLKAMNFVLHSPQIKWDSFGLLKHQTRCNKLKRPK